MLTIYKASAGSGKTFTLAYEYIKTLLGIRTEKGSYRLNSAKYAPDKRRRSRRHRGILALTFTNAATEEMKRRIIKQINALSDETQISESDYAEKLTKEYGCTVGELRDAATQALSELLYDYSNFNVSTIDSFFQGVLRTFSREVDQQGDYELALDSHDAVTQSISLMLDELNYSTPSSSDRLIKWIGNYTLEKVSEGSAFNFFERDGKLIGDLASAMEKSMDETFGNYSKALREYLSDENRLSRFDNALRQASKNAFSHCAKLADDITNRLGAMGLTVNILGAFHKRFDVARDKAKVESNTFTIKAFAEGRNDTDLISAANIKKYGNMPGFDAVLRLSHEFCDELPVANKRRKMYDALRNSLGTLDFIGMTLGSLEKYLRDSNMVLLSDTGELLKRIISDAEMPFIYERLGMKLETLLIDEFQDTSRVQWHNLKPLVGNSLAQNYDNLIIGDEKQSIYRFRNSDSELLGRQVQTEDFPRESIVKGNKTEENTNWRSAKDIVRFNNTVFDRLRYVYGAGYYSNVIQTPAKKNADKSAYIEINFHTDPIIPDNETILKKLAEDILRQHTSGYHWRDILILCRHRDEAKETVKYLIDNYPEIRVLSSEALLLRNSSAVRSIMSMLRLVSQSYQSRDIYLSSDKKKNSSRSDIVMTMTRYHHYQSEGLSPEDALSSALEEVGDDSLKEQIEAIRAENPANLVALIEAIITHKLSDQQRREEYAYIAALVDMAIKQAESAEPSLADFIAAYDRNETKWAIKASSELDAVEVMTIHKSKGLERACVHIPFGDWEMYHATTTMWLPMSGFKEFADDIKPPLLRVTVADTSPLRDSKISPVAGLLKADRQAETIDNLNTTYVAYTRASRELIVHCHTKNIGGELHKLFTEGGYTVTEGFTLDLRKGYDPLTETYTLGSPTSPTEAPKPPRATVSADVYPVIYRKDTRELVSIDDALSTDLDIGDEADKEIVDKPKDFESTPEMQEAARKGTNLHAILATMRTVEDLPRALAWQCSRENIEASEAKEYEKTLREAIAHGGEEVRQWFSPENKVYAERSIYVPSIGMSFRPDRVVVCPDSTVIVVDYKFTSEVRKTHYDQVRNYMALLAGLGRRKVDGYLWYPAQKKIIKIE